MGRETGWRSTRPVAALWVVAVLGLLPTAAAQALQFDVYFDGPILVDEADDPSRFGLSETQALALRDAGVTLREDLVGRKLPPLSVTDQDFQGFAPDPPIDPDVTTDKNDRNRAASVWTLKSARPLAFDQVILFTHSDAFEKEGVTVDYPDDRIGITIDSNDWVIVKLLDENMNPFYYPGIELSREDLDSPDGAMITVEYVLNDAFIPAPAGSDKFQLPELQMGRALVPEPSTALLLASGLLTLAGRRPRR